MDNNMDNTLNNGEIFKQAMQLQAVVNIGMIGHVANGKSTTTRCLTGISTQKHKSELARNITIRLGYANAKIYKCDKCVNPECYQSVSSTIMEHECDHCGSNTELLIHYSIVDCPGHHDFMNVMLNGTAVMDYAMLVESVSNKEFPAPQTIEHFSITNEMGIPVKVAILNKVDLLLKSKKKIPERMAILQDFVGDNIPVIPVSGSLDCNIDILTHYISTFDIPNKDLDSNIKMVVIRSFNTNVPGTSIQNLKGGVLGGSIIKGIMRIGDIVSIYPGLIMSTKNANKKEEQWKYAPLQATVKSINSEKNSLEFAVPGGLIGVQLDIDPGLTCDDKLVGQVVHKVTENMSHVKVYEAIRVDYFKLSGFDDIFLKHPNIVAQMDLSCIDEDGSTKKFMLRKTSKIFINVNSNKINCTIYKIKSDNMMIMLDKPICADIDDKIAINVIIGDTSHIFGHGIIKDGMESIKI
jgi:translation initiation factor 2 subunit 3